MNSEASDSNPMSQRLSESRRAELIREEIFRQEVREQIVARQEKRFKSKILIFLNSSLGIWFLSSIVLSAISFGYNRLQSNTIKSQQIAADLINVERVRQQEISRLDLEISFRFSNIILFLDDLNDQKTEEERGAMQKVVVTPNLLKELLVVPPYEAFKINTPGINLYAEYERSTLIGLLAELTRLETERLTALRVEQSPLEIEVQLTVVEALETVTDDVSSPTRLFNRMPRQFPRGERGLGFITTEERLKDYGPVDARLMAKSVQFNLILPRWRKANFSYLDCTPGSVPELIEPFC